VRIGIDARFLTHPQVGGFKRYTEGLVKALVTSDRENQYVLYVDRDVSPSALPAHGSNVTVRVVAGTVPYVGMPWREQVGLPWRAWRDRLDVLHSLAATGPLVTVCPFVVTIHDTLWMNRPTRRQGLLRRLGRPIDWYYWLVPRLVARRAESVVTVSNYSAAELSRRLGLDPARVQVTRTPSALVIPNGEPGAVAEVLRARQLSPGFVLGTASADSRKNAPMLVDAMARLRRRRTDVPCLVIVCTRRELVGAIREEARRLGVEGYVVPLEPVTDAELVALYQSASVFAFPSSAEGLGLPVLEAMSLGTPVVAFANSSIPEVAGGAAWLCAEGVEPLTDALERVLGDDDLRRRLIARGRVQASGYSWRNCAELTLGCYRAASARQKRPLPRRSRRQEPVQRECAPIAEERRYQ
jgi:glycosyltransferase involved in cell wall biosynthesis